MIKVTSAYDSDNHICEFEPDAKMPLAEAYPMHGFDGNLITIMATNEYQIHAIQERDGGYIVRAGDGTTPILSPDTMVYVKFDDLSFDRKKLAEKETIIQAVEDKYKVIE